MFDFSSLTTDRPPSFPSEILNRLIVALEKLGAPMALPSDQEISKELGVDYTSRHKRVLLETAKRETARRWIGARLGTPDGGPVVPSGGFTLWQELTLQRNSAVNEIDNIVHEVGAARKFNLQQEGSAFDCFARDVRRQCNEIADMFYGPLSGEQEAPQNADVRGVVYFISIGDPSVVKIGFTTNMETRLRSLRTASPAEPHIHVTFEAGPLDESDLHRRFAADRINREWFRFSAEIAAFIENKKVKAGGGKPG